MRYKAGSFCSEPQHADSATNINATRMHYISGHISAAEETLNSTISWVTEFQVQKCSYSDA